MARPTTPILVATSNSVRNQVLPKLATFDEITLAGLANTPEIALKMLIQERPEAVILDIDFGGPLGGLDTARMMQKTRAQAGIIMLVPDIDPEIHHSKARRFGTSWSYIRKLTASRENLLGIAIKSSVRGVQWIEPELSRPLAELWKVAAQARDMEARRSDVAVVAVPTSIGRKSLKNSIHGTDASSSTQDSETAGPADNANPAQANNENSSSNFEDVEMAPGIELKSTSENPDDEVEGIEITSVSVGKGGVGQGVGRVRKAM